MQWTDFSGMIEMINKGDFCGMVSRRKKVQEKRKGSGFIPGGKRYRRREKAVGLFLYAKNNKEIHESLASNPYAKRRVFKLSVKKKPHSGPPSDS